MSKPALILGSSSNYMSIEQEVILDKHLRKDLDAQLQILKNASKSRERSLTITKLQEAIMWLGMDMKQLNESSPGVSPNPYPTSYDPTTPKVEPTSEGLKL